MENKGLFAFAGLWEYWKNETEILESCTIITINANKIMQPIHHRMPVILEANKYDEWLEIGGKDLLQPFSGKMASHSVSTRVNNPINNDQELIQPINL